MSDRSLSDEICNSSWWSSDGGVGCWEDDDDDVVSSVSSVGDGGEEGEGGKRGMKWNPLLSFRCGGCNKLEPGGALLRSGCGNSESFNGDGVR
jgi:hypothetical protein